MSLSVYAKATMPADRTAVNAVGDHFLGGFLGDSRDGRGMVVDLRERRERKSAGQTVVLRAQLYNPPVQFHNAVNLVEDYTRSEGIFGVRSPVRRSDRTPTLRKMTILTEREIQDLINDYQSGATIKALAEKYQIHRVTVYQHLDRNNIPRRQRGLTPDQIRHAAQLYDAGDSLATIGRRFNVDAQTVRNRLAEAGVQIRKRRGWRRA